MMKICRFILSGGIALCLTLVMSSCQMPTETASLTSSPFGTTADGTPITRYTMTGKTGVSVSFINYGGIITATSKLIAPEKLYNLPHSAIFQQF
ncbi:hypothetical protein [Chlorogloea sp. CCALA 695]|uniref:hypothetical protein n=1 Tax=Chlorogloea sp. CCALA 695 TaxID=2107693 RepID=UPI0011B2559E|nr:hypothetical protein [Chlorogloea sp. CCALA 695]